MDKCIKSLDLLVDETAEMLLSLLRERGLTVAFAESCTGGLCASRVTAVPGSSEAVLGGVVSYANSVKSGVLGVREETLSSFGAVSVETAREMAEGVRRLTGADICVSVSGIAGPGGGSAEKPVGTVCFGVASPLGSFSEIQHFDSTLSRGEIRRLASDHALTLAANEAKKAGDNNA